VVWCGWRWFRRPALTLASLAPTHRYHGCLLPSAIPAACTQAIAAWRDGSGYARTQLVQQYFQCVEGFTQPEVLQSVPLPEGSQQSGGGLLSLLPKQLRALLSSGVSDPFNAVVAYRNFRPVSE
jgi:hypothetical protein